MNNALFDIADVCNYRVERPPGAATPLIRMLKNSSSLARASPVRHLFYESSDDASNDIEDDDDDASYYNIDADNNDPSDDVIAPNEIEGLC